MTIQDLASQMDQALFGRYSKISLNGREIFIIPRGPSRTVQIRNYVFVTQDPHEKGALGDLAREGVRVVWIEVDGKVRGDGYVNGTYVANVVDHCLEMVSARV